MFEIGDYVLNATNLQNKRNRGVRHVRRQAAQVIFFTPPC